MDRIAQHDQFLEMAKASLRKERTFIVFTFPSEEEFLDEKQPEVYVSAHASGVVWAIDRLMESLMMGEIQIRVERFREFLDGLDLDEDDSE